MALAVASLMVPSETASSMAAPRSAATTTQHSITAALQVRGTPIRVGRAVSFAFAGSKIDSRFHMAASKLSFGDKTSVRVSSLSGSKSHRYKHKGVYTVTFRLVDSGGQVALKKRTIVVAGANTLKFRATTRRLPPHAVAAVRAVDAAHLRITLLKGTSLPPLGSTLVVAPGGVVPRGAAIVVRARSSDGTGRPVLQGPNAGLSDIYSTLRTATTTKVPNKIRLTQYGAGGLPMGRIWAASTAVPFSCHAAHTDRPIKVTADLSQTRIEPTIDLGARTFQLIVNAKPTFSLGVSFAGTADCSLGDYFALNIPVPAVPGLVVSISPYFKLTASGTISASVSYSPTFTMQVIRSPSRSVNILQLTSHASAEATGAASVSLEGGLSLSVSVAQAAGFEAQLGPKISVEASTSTANGGQTCVTAKSAIEASVRLFAHVMFWSKDVSLYDGEFYKTTLFNKCTPTGTTGGAPSGSGSGSSEGSPSGSGSGGGGGGTALPPGPASVTAANNNGQMGVQLVNFPLGTAYYFCHAGDSAAFPSGGTITGRGQITLTRFNATFQSGLCAGSGNTWIGFQAPDGQDYFSNQVNLVYVPPTVTASNNNGQMAVNLANYPLGTTYYFCHAGDPSDFPTGGSLIGQGHFSVTSSSSSYSSGICSGSGNSWIGFQAPDGHDYYSNQVGLHYSPPTATASNNNGHMAVQLGSFPLGITYFFCHSGVPGDYPSGGVVTNHGQVNVTSADQDLSSGLCSGRGNAWIGFQATDGHDYFSNQVDLVAAATPGAGVTAANNNGQMAVQVTGFPLGITYFFCHSGVPGDYPSGGVITNRGQVNVTSAGQDLSSGLCSGRGNAWIGLQATDGADYFSNQVDLYAPPTAGADVHVTGNNGNLDAQFSAFPTGVTYYFCHAGDPSGYPTGGSVPSHGQITITSPNQSFGSLCSGAGNSWIGFQATDGHDYYTNQIIL